MTELQRYLAEEIAEDCADGLISRREPLRRLGLLGLSVTAGSSLIAAFAAQATKAGAAPTIGMWPDEYSGNGGVGNLVGW
jgi:carboxymethylenebutenolidase